MRYTYLLYPALSGTTRNTGTMKKTAQATPPARRFDVTVGAITAKEHVPDDETEDLELTAYLVRAWSELVSRSGTPIPRCPHCDGLRIRCDGVQKSSEIPSYFCHQCGRSFNRFTNTPFAGLHDRGKGTAMIPLLSRQMSLMQAGERLGRSQKAVLSWLLAFRRYLLELDPDGHWEARVRLGVHVAPHARCVRCGFEGGFLAGGFDPQRRRRVRCPACGRSRLLDVLQQEGLARDAVVTLDSIDTALRARRKVHPDTAAPLISRTATVEEAVPDTVCRDQPRLGGVALTRRFRLSTVVERNEDPVLSAFLLRAVDSTLSDGREPPACPWCASDQTGWHPAPRPSGLPGFKCRACLAYFTRASNTPLSSGMARSHARRLIPILGWCDTARAAAHELGVGASVLSRWLKDWRRWLLILDPGGAMEARVRLGSLRIERSPEKSRQHIAIGASMKGETRKSL